LGRFDQRLNKQKKLDFQLTNKDIHLMGSAADNHSDEDEYGADQSDIATAQKIGQGTNEWTDAGQSDEIGQDKPNPAVNASNVGINVWGNATCGGPLAPCSGGSTTVGAYQKYRREFDFLSREKPWQSRT
jgi:hypothetical protein